MCVCVCVGGGGGGGEGLLIEGPRLSPDIIVEHNPSPYPLWVLNKTAISIDGKVDAEKEGLLSCLYLKWKDWRLGTWV